VLVTDKISIAGLNAHGRVVERFEAEDNVIHAHTLQRLLIRGSLLVFVVGLPELGASVEYARG
jgi:hypothetical protein